MLLVYVRLGTQVLRTGARLLDLSPSVDPASGPLGRKLLSLNAANGMVKFTLPVRTPPVLLPAITYPTKLSAVPPLPLDVPPPMD